jgi:hypothetical protein
MVGSPPPDKMSLRKSRDVKTKPARASRSDRKHPRNARAFTEVSVAPSRASSTRLKAAGCRSQALYLFVSRFNVFVDLIDLRVFRIVAAQLIQQFADGEFIYFGHRDLRCALVTSTRKSS